MLLGLYVHLSDLEDFSVAWREAGVKQGTSHFFNAFNGTFLS